MWRQDALTTYSACPPNPIRKVKSVDTFREKQGSSPLANPPYNSGKYTTANSIGAKQLPKIKDFAPLRPFVIVVSGASNVGKSALIKLAQNKLRLAETAANNERRHVHTLSIEDMTYPVEIVELNIDMFDTSQEPLQMPKVS
ncbi:hypothetical protein INT43_000437 [Umbelopsis isabellina]|uniref:Uncharacterized protein n=1 Tax=Mortierella isabellina TaxID=91625 RepID=A0A8H7Q3A8_MORIS|nr:hypothetical protein INT43_000437 [Umbelopsis isabellina]